MKKTYKLKILIIVILMLIFMSGCFYFFMINKDINGLTHRDVWQAERVLKLYIDAQNAHEYEKCTDFLSEIYADKIEAMYNMFELSSGIIYEDFQADYREKECRKDIEKIRNQYVEFVENPKIIYFTCSFTIVANQEGSELGSGLMQI